MAGLDDGGQPLPFDPEPLVSALDALPFEPSTRGGRKMRTGSGEALCAWVEAPLLSSKASHVLAFSRLRSDAVPLAELSGRRTPVSIPSDGTLCETSHVAFYPGNVLGVEFNFFGPRVTRLGDYLRGVLRLGDTPFEAEQILRSDVADQLDADRGLRVLDLSIRPSYAETVRQADDSLAAAFAAMAAAGQPAQVGVVLKAEPRKRSATLGEGLLTTARAIARLPGLRQNAERYKVKSINSQGRVHELDMLQDAFVRSEQVTVLDSRSRAVDRSSALGAIEKAFTELTELGALEAASVQAIRDPHGPT
ncbi:hypothetical protein [Jatrophihabitans fulvus]